jgi:hypothetical protein
LLIVLDRLDPAERLAFVLHDMFAVSFDETASIVGRSPEAARQLASRARRRVQGAPAVPKTNLMEQRRVVDTFLDALRRGDFEELIAVLDPDIVVTVDAAAATAGAPRVIRGARNWARGAIAFSRQLPGIVQPMLVNGEVGLVWSPAGTYFVCFSALSPTGKLHALRSLPIQIVFANSILGFWKNEGCRRFECEGLNFAPDGRIHRCDERSTPGWRLTRI